MLSSNQKQNIVVFSCRTPKEPESLQWEKGDLLVTGT